MWQKVPMCMCESDHPRLELCKQSTWQLMPAYSLAYCYQLCSTVNVPIRVRALILHRSIRVGNQLPALLRCVPTLRPGKDDDLLNNNSIMKIVISWLILFFPDSLELCHYNATCWIQHGNIPWHACLDFGCLSKITCHGQDWTRELKSW